MNRPGFVPEPDLARIEQEAAQSLANRLQARAAADTPGFLLLNPVQLHPARGPGA